MSDESALWYADLVAMVLYVGLVAGAVVVDLPWVVRAALVIPLVLLLPGYAIVSVVFPARTPRENVESHALDPLRRDVHAALPRNYGINMVERLALSLVLSLAVVPLVAFALNFTSLSLSAVPLLLTVGGLVVGLSIVAFVQRARIPPVRRFALLQPVVMPRDVDASGYRRFLAGATWGPDDVLVRGLLALSLVAFVGAVAFAATVPTLSGEPFTETYLVAENEDGNLTTDAVPRRYTEGEAKEVVFGITNQEQGRTGYLVIVKLQRIDTGTVTEEERVTRFGMVLDTGETRQHRHEIRPQISGENLRLTYLVYRNQAPFRPSAANAYRVLRVDVTVAPGTETRARQPDRRAVPATTDGGAA
jgi:uncharacterized membrane protein